MKISPKTYALLTYDVLRESDQEKQKRMFAGLVELIKKNKDQRKLPQIKRFLDDIVAQKEGLVEMELETAWKVRDDLKEEIREIFSQKAMGNKGKMIIQEKINPGLIGGARIKIRSDFWDFSWQTILKKLKKAIAN